MYEQVCYANSIKKMWADSELLNGLFFPMWRERADGSKVSLVTRCVCTGGLEIKRPTHTPPTTQHTELLCRCVYPGEVRLTFRGGAGRMSENTDRTSYFLKNQGLKPLPRSALSGSFLALFSL